MLIRGGYCCYFFHQSGKVGCHTCCEQICLCSLKAVNFILSNRNSAVSDLTFVWFLKPVVQQSFICLPDLGTVDQGLLNFFKAAL